LRTTYSFRGLGIVVEVVGGEDLVGYLQLTLAEELCKKTALHSLNLFGGRHPSAPSLLCILGSSGCETTNSRLKSLVEGIPIDPPCPPGAWVFTNFTNCSDGSPYTFIL
jgi:hypothetical protein